MKRVIFDLETTGTNVQEDRIVQIAIISVEGGKTTKFKSLVDPEMFIPLEAIKVHGIHNEDIKGQPTFTKLANKILGFFDGASEIVTHNGNNYDIPLLMTEFGRVGITLDLSTTKLIDTLIIEKKLNNNTLGGLYEKYAKKTLDDAHDAMRDVEATIEILEHQLKLLSEEEFNELFDREKSSMADIAGKFVKMDGELLWNFGKHKGKSVLIDDSYIKWFLSADFPNESKSYLRNYLSEVVIINMN